MTLGEKVYKFGEEDMNERFYYSGGSVREFTRSDVGDIQASVADACDKFENPSQPYRLCRMLIVRTESGEKESDESIFLALKNREHWQQAIDSEYAVRILSTCLRAEALGRMYSWAALGAGYNSLAGSLFEVFVHSLAREKRLGLFVSDYNKNENGQSNEETSYDFKLMALRTSVSTYSAIKKEKYEACLKAWRDDPNLTYWSPECRELPNIDSIAKLTHADGKKSVVAYLQITIAGKLCIDAKRLQEMNDIFFPDEVKSAGDTDLPMYIALCPNKDACKNIVLETSRDVEDAQKICRVCVGCCSTPLTSAGSMNNVPRNEKRQPPSHDTRSKAKQQRTDEAEKKGE